MSTYAELKRMLDQAEWNWIKPHLARNAVILVNKDLEFLDVGLQVANNQTPQIEKWIQSGQLRKPTQQEITAWDLLQSKKFHYLIIQPYVLVQELETFH